MKISYEDFLEKYRPVKNNIDDNAAFDGFMFETYGEEFEKVQAANPKCIWTYCSGSVTGDYITSGGWRFDRLGYFITEVPFEGERGEIEIMLEDTEEFGITPDQFGLFVEFSKNIANNPFPIKNLEKMDADRKQSLEEEIKEIIEEIFERVEEYEENKDSIEPLFVYVRQYVDEYSHFDTEWGNFLKENK